MSVVQEAEPTKIDKTGPCPTCGHWVYWCKECRATGAIHCNIVDECGQMPEPPQRAALTAGGPER